MEMANLSPKTTGLPLTVWVGGPIAGGRKHAPRIKVLKDNELVPVTVTDFPQQVAGNVQLSRRELLVIRNWILQHKEVILKHLDGQIDSADLIDAIRKK